MLELNKPFTYMINWEQDKEGRHRMSNQRQPIEIIKSQTTLLEEIPAKTQVKVTKLWVA